MIQMTATHEDIQSMYQNYCDDYNEYPTACMKYEVLNVKNGDGFTIIRRCNHVYVYPNTVIDVTLMGDDAEVEVWKSDEYAQSYFVKVTTYNKGIRCGTMAFCFREFEFEHLQVSREFI